MKWPNPGSRFELGSALGTRRRLEIDDFGTEVVYVTVISERLDSRADDELSVCVNKRKLGAMMAEIMSAAMTADNQYVGKHRERERPVVGTAPWFFHSPTKWDYYSDC